MAMGVQDVEELFMYVHSVTYLFISFVFVCFINFREINFTIFKLNFRLPKKLLKVVDVITNNVLLANHANEILAKID